MGEEIKPPPSLPQKGEGSRKRYKGPSGKIKKKYLYFYSLNSIFAMEKQLAKPRLYDSETDAYLNDKTMKVIEDARTGEGIAFQGSLEDFKAMAESL